MTAPDLKPCPNKDIPRQRGGCGEWWRRFLRRRCGVQHLSLHNLWQGGLAVTEPDRIWISEKWEVYLRPTFDGDTSGYIRADLARAPLAEALAVPTEAQIAAAVNAVWSELEDSKTQRWTLRKEHIHNAVATALRAIGERADG